MINTKKPFIITIDNEEDNQWGNAFEDLTNNAKYIPRFQLLCDKFMFKPVYLTTYRMAMDPFFVEFGKDALKKEKCEIGMHLHAWNTPPKYEFQNSNGNKSYLIEYPVDIMREKIRILDSLLTEAFDYKPTTHRAGRWAMNDSYLRLLEESKYQCDCSYTPGVNWSSITGETGFPGNNYEKIECKPCLVGEKMLEVPMTIHNVHYYEGKRVKSPKTFVKEVYHLIKGKKIWLRPSIATLGQMKSLIKSNKDDYIMFMIHSSELMPNGSPYYKTQYEIDALYETLEALFEFISNQYYGCTLAEFTVNYFSNK